MSGGDGKFRKTNTKKQVCLCQAVRPCFSMLKAYGFLAINSDHDENEQCRFKKSTFWLCYGFFTIVLLIVNLMYNTEVSNVWNVHREKSLHEFLNSITHIIYAIYIILLTILNLSQTSRYVKAFNRIVPLLNHGLLCQSALRAIRNLQYKIMVVVLFGIVTQAIALLWLNYSSGFSKTTLNFSTFGSHMIQNTTCVLYIMFACVCSIISGCFACFQKLVIDILKHQRVYSRKNIEPTNNFQRFLGVWKYKLCDEEHSCDEALSKLKLKELIEYLRCLHETVSVVQYEMNACVDLQLLLHLIAELVVMIINYYAVVAYFVHGFTTPSGSTINFLNCVYVVLHTIGIFSVLLMPQYVHNMVKGSISLLLEFSTSVSTPEEHLQLRIFATKLKNHRLFTAYGAVTVDLSIAASICANILTYVLVALQFRVSNA